MTNEVWKLPHLLTTLESKVHTSYTAEARVREVALLRSSEKAQPENRFQTLYSCRGNCC